MAGEREFSHITVNADDDDVVIQAGAPVGAQPDELDAGAAAGPADSPYETPFETDEAPDLEPEVAADLEPEASEGPDGSELREEAPWREQTEEDLDAGPMSVTQKIVLGLAAALIIVAVVYYAVFLR